VDEAARTGPNQLLRAARQATASTASPGFALSRSELAELVNAVLHRRTGRSTGIDGHYIAKLERGAIRWPGEHYRQALREVLGAATDSELGFHRPRSLTRSAPLLRAFAPGRESDEERLAWTLAGRNRVDATTVQYLRETLTAQRHLEDALGSVRMLPVLLPVIGLVEGLVEQARGPTRRALVTLVAECREFAGRMADYNGDRRAALRHDGRGLSAAREAEDANLVGAVYGLRSHLAWGAGDADGAIALADAALRAGGLSARVEGFSVQMRARGHAQRGEPTAAERLIDRAEQLTGRATEHPEDEPWWTYQQTPERVHFQRAVALLHLGRYPEARDLLTRARGALPARYRRDHGRLAAAHALACAHDGDLVRSLSAGREAMTILLDTGSVYTVVDLRRVPHVLRHQRLDRDAIDEFEEALTRITGADPAGDPNSPQVPRCRSPWPPIPHAEW
jgi:tetratricopeptide (TPR) repeat protein